MAKKIEIEKAKNGYLARDEDGNVTLFDTLDELFGFLRIIFE